VEAVRDEGLGDANVRMRDFLLGVLSAYELAGEAELATSKLGDFLTARYGSLADAKRALGEVANIRQAFFDIQRQIYRS
jgi:type I restriction enzyme R subunit